MQMHTMMIEMVKSSGPQPLGCGPVPVRGSFVVSRTETINNMHYNFPIYVFSES